MASCPELSAGRHVNTVLSGFTFCGLDLVPKTAPVFGPCIFTDRPFASHDVAHPVVASPSCQCEHGCDINQTRGPVSFHLYQTHTQKSYGAELSAAS